MVLAILWCLVYTDSECIEAGMMSTYDRFSVLLILFMLIFLDGVGLPVYLEENARWPTPDKDYTPYKNIISAVWPSLRHGNYKYAIIDAKNVDVTTYYKQVNQLNLKDPCIPDAIRCGTTGKYGEGDSFHLQIGEFDT